MDRTPESQEDRAVFQAPPLLMGLFYGVLLIWTVATIPPIYRRFLAGGFQGDWLFAVMIGFFYCYTWFWSLGLFYRIALDGEGRIELTSLRRTLAITAKQIRAIEGSRFPEGFGFVRMKLPRESAYLFCHRIDDTLERIFRRIRGINPLIRAARI